MGEYQAMTDPDISELAAVPAAPSGVRWLLWRFGPLVVLGGVVAVIAAGLGLLVGLHPVIAVVVVGLVTVVAGALLLWRARGPQATSTVGLGPALVAFAAAGVVVLVGIQAVPYGRAHDNPRTTGEPEWATPRTRELMVNACFGCHSNEVEWPWYSSIAPISWAVTNHVDEGREKVNYSEFATRGGEYEETIEVILEGSMPPSYYTRFGLHPEAKLTDAEVAELVAGLRATPGLRDGDEDRNGERDEREDEDEDDDD